MSLYLCRHEKLRTSLRGSTNPTPTREERPHPPEHDNHGIRTIAGTGHQLLKRLVETNRVTHEGQTIWTPPREAVASELELSS
mgnify:CR=1 FL=1